MSDELKSTKTFVIEGIEWKANWAIVNGQKILCVGTSKGEAEGVWPSEAEFAVARKHAEELWGVQQ